VVRRNLRRKHGFTTTISPHCSGKKGIIMKRQIIEAVVLTSVALFVASGLWSCDRSDADKAGNNVQNAADKTGDAVNKGIDKAGAAANTGITAANDAGQVAVDKTMNATTQARTAVGQAAETSSEALNAAGTSVNQWISPTSVPSTAPVATPH
jgi:hypothetical protein